MRDSGWTPASGRRWRKGTRPKCDRGDGGPRLSRAGHHPCTTASGRRGPPGARARLGDACLLWSAPVAAGLRERGQLASAFALRLLRRDKQLALLVRLRRRRMSTGRRRRRKGSVERERESWNRANLRRADLERRQTQNLIDVTYGHFITHDAVKYAHFHEIFEWTKPANTWRKPAYDQETRPKTGLVRPQPARPDTGTGSDGHLGLRYSGRAGASRPAERARSRQKERPDEAVE